MSIEPMTTIDTAALAKDLADEIEAELDGRPEKEARLCLSGAEARALAALLRGVVAGAGESFQSRVDPWMQACFGPAISADRLERGDRLLEEVLELLQSGSYPAERVSALTGYVWSRPAGDPPQEVGGVMVTLAAYCLAHGLDMHEAGETELARIWTKVEKIRAKQAAKPTGSALPQAWPTALPAESWGMLGRFGHHPDPAVDFCLEVEVIQGEAENHRLGFTAGTPSRDDIVARIERAMAFRVGGDAGAVAAKQTLREIEADFKTPAPPAESGEVEPSPEECPTCGAVDPEKHCRMDWADMGCDHPRRLREVEEDMTGLFGTAPPGESEPVAVPDGWKLVPVEPTPEMMAAACASGPAHPVLKYLTPEERSPPTPLIPLSFWRAMIHAVTPATEVPPSALDQPYAWWAETGTAGAGDGCNKPFWLRHEAIAYVRRHGGHVAPLFRRWSTAPAAARSAAEEMRERCARYVEEHFPYDRSHAGAIRALPLPGGEA